MFDARGRVIGIAAQIRSSSGNAEGVGFAVPINSARRSLRQLLQDGKVHYAYVGVHTQTLTPAAARRLGYGVDRGAIVEAVSSGSPADAAGFRGATGEEEVDGVAVARGGDVVVAIDGVRVTSADDLVRIVTNRLRPRQTAVFTILRDGRHRSVAVRLATRPAVP